MNLNDLLGNIEVSRTTISLKIDDKPPKFGDDTVYRCESFMIDNFELTLEFKQYVIFKRTPCGFWITDYRPYNRQFKDVSWKKFILKNAIKSYAYSDKTQALNSFIKRKIRHIAILENQLYLANASYDGALKYQKSLHLEQQ